MFDHNQVDPKNQKKETSKFVSSRKTFEYRIQLTPWQKN
jgi:hypothetical protein